MIVIIAFIVVAIIMLVAVLRAEKPFSVVWAEAKFEFTYMLCGARALFEDIWMRKKNVVELEKKVGKVAVITGGTRGIGAKVIEMLLDCDITVIMGCRNINDAQKLKEQIKLRNNLIGGDLIFYQLDVSSLQSVNAFAREVISNYSRINYLINNAAIMRVPYFDSTDGFESQFATNYLGHFLLTHHLLPLLKASGNPKEASRIINVTSCAYVTTTIDFDDINKKKLYIPFEAYGQSKLAQILFTKYLSKVLEEQESPVKTFCVHPGIVNTELFQTTYLARFPSLMSLLFKKPEEGARTIIYATISKELEELEGGSYITNCTITQTADFVNDIELQKKFFEFTKRLVKVENYGFGD